MNSMITLDEVLISEVFLPKHSACVTRTCALDCSAVRNIGWKGAVLFLVPAKIGSFEFLTVHGPMLLL